MRDAPVLGSNRRDLAVALSKGIVASVPFLGGLISEVVEQIIPGQKLDRVIEFVELLGKEIAGLEDRYSAIEAHLKGSQGSDLLEEGIIQASRAVSAERRQRIARIVARAVADSEVRYDRARKLLSILDGLTDSEVLLLLYHSEIPTSGSAWHRELMERYPDIPRPVSRETNVPQAERERGALHDSYIATLLSSGLLRDVKGTKVITELGRLLLALAADPEAVPEMDRDPEDSSV